ncbi:MAG: heme-binding protein [Kineosporiaceae bacterium]
MSSPVSSAPAPAAAPPQSGDGAPGMPPIASSLPLAVAQAYVAAALTAAGDGRVAVVVVDAGGHVVASARGDGVSPVGLEFARRKAVAAASFGAPTEQFRRMILMDPALSAAMDAFGADLLVLGGGLPVVRDGVVIGGVGVSGGHHSADARLVLAVVEAVEGSPAAG